MYDKTIKRNKWLILFLLFGLSLRLIDIAKPFSGLSGWNEGHYATTAYNYFTYGILLPVNEYGVDITTTPIFSWLIYISFRIFGVHEWAARLPSLIFAMSSLFLVYLIAKKLYDKDVALVSTFIAAVSPGTIYFSSAIQLESMFTAFALASLLFMIYYKDTYDVKWFMASGIYLSIAILAKYPAILTYPALLWIWFMYGKRNEDREWTKLVLYLVLPIIPTLLWLYYAATLKPTLTSWYFYKPEAPWTLARASSALFLAVTRYIPEHFGYVFYIFFIPALLLSFKSFKKHAAILIFTLIWLLLIAVFPDFYLTNWYYHYSMLYGMAILLGYFVIRVGKKIGQNTDMDVKKMGAVVLVMVLGLSLYQFNSDFRSFYVDFSTINETEPFYSAKYVAKINTAHELVLVDFPNTMFYSGADPEYVKPGYYKEGILQAVNQVKYPYVVLYFSANKTIKTALEKHGYTKIAPRAWYKEISNSSG